MRCVAAALIASQEARAEKKGQAILLGNFAGTALDLVSEGEDRSGGSRQGLSTGERMSLTHHGNVTYIPR
jgi:hypothetical protein